MSDRRRTDFGGSGGRRVHTPRSHTATQDMDATDRVAVPEEVTERVEPPASVLLRSSSRGSNTETVLCRQLLTHPSGEVTVHFVTFDGAPPSRAKARQARLPPTQQATAHVIHVGDSPAVGWGDTKRITSDPVAQPGDLTGLGIALTDRLTDVSESRGQLVMCFETVASLLQYSDLERVFRFLHGLTGQVMAADALMHVHLDISSHDDRTLNSLTTLFDAVVDVTDGTITMATR